MTVSVVARSRLVAGGGKRAEGGAPSIPSFSLRALDGPVVVAVERRGAFRVALSGPSTDVAAGSRLSVSATKKCRLAGCAAEVTASSVVRSGGSVETAAPTAGASIKFPNVVSGVDASVGRDASTHAARATLDWRLGDEASTQMHASRGFDRAATLRVSRKSGGGGRLAVTAHSRRGKLSRLEVSYKGGTVGVSATLAGGRIGLNYGQELF